MKLPALSELNTSRELIDVFAGYNHNLRIGDGEFYDMKNLTSSDYPVLSPRPKRGRFATPSNPQGMIAKDALCYVDGDRLYINGSEVKDTEKADMSLYEKCDSCPKQETCDNYKEGSTTCEKTLISMGAYIIIMPDKKYVNTSNTTECGSIEAEFTATTGSVTFDLCKLDGESYGIDDVPKGDTPPSAPKNLDLWLDTSSTPHSLKQYAEATEQWTSIATTYIKIAFPNSTTILKERFSANDGLTLSGITDPSVSDLDNKTMVVWDVGDNYIVVTGILDKCATQEATGEEPVSIKRLMPNMDYITESGNRLWGCRYGFDIDGAVVNEIYASKLGDFKNWRCYAGLSTDSYAATVGTDGRFTGAVTHLGYPLFFKENYVHKVYGNYPANYQIQTTACRGVEFGCSKSLAIVNEVLYYKSHSGICAYDGSLPVDVSAALGDVIYSDAVAGALGNKYYVSMKEESSNPIPQYHLFAFDTKRGMWHREDDTQAIQFCNCRGDLYFIDHADNQIKTVKGTGTVDTSSIEWMAETGVIGMESPDKKYISRIDIRLSLAVGARVFVHIQYDSLGDWEQAYAMTGITLRSFAIPLRPKRCDHLRLRISGVGEAKIYSICKTIEQGSDV